MTTSQIDQTAHPFSIPKLSIGFVITLLVGYGLGFVYGIVSGVMPVVYLSVVCTVIFGTALGYASIFANYFTKQLHKPSKYILAGISGLAAWYFSWVSYIIFINKDALTSISEAYFRDMLLVFQPGEVFRIMGEINAIGLWEIAGTAINGTSLAFMWAIEAVIIIAVPIILVHKQHDQPFSETQNSWYREFVLEKDFASVFGLPSFKEDLKLNPVECIENIGFGKANLYTQISIYYLAEEDTQYISLFNVRISSENKKEKDEIIHMMEISKQDAQFLMEKWKAKKTLVPFL